MIPLNITPVSAPTAPSTAAVGDLGQMIADIAYRNKKLAEDARQADMSAEINRSATEGKNRYYDLEGDTHRMLAEDRAQAQKDKGEATANKRLDFLRDAYRKAQTAGERNSILDQIRSHAASMGLSFDEIPGEQSATSVTPEEATGAQVPAGGKPGFSPFLGPKGAPMKTPGVNPKFAAGLAAYMQSPDAAASDAGAPADGGVPDVSQPSNPTVSPFPWDKLGLPSPPQTPPTTPTQKGSGRFALKDKQGNLMQVWDESSRDADTKAAIVAGMKSQPGSSPEEQRAAAAAVQEASAFASQIGVEKAIQFADAKYKAILGEYKKQPTTAQKGSGGGAAGPSKADVKLTGMDREEVHKIINDFKGNYDPKGIIQAERMAHDAVKSIDAGGGMNELNALKQYMVQMSGKVVTDREMSQFLDSTGKWATWETEVKKYGSGGFSPKFKAALRDMLGRFELNSAKRRLDIASSARDQAKSGGLDDASQSRVYNFFSGDTGGGPEVTPLRERGKAPAKGGSKKDELKALLESGQ